IGLVQVEELGLAVDRDIAPAAQESRDAGSFGHVLLPVPRVELAAAFRRNVVPDRDGPRARQAHVWDLALRRRVGERDDETESALSANAANPAARSGVAASAHIARRS